MKIKLVIYSKDKEYVGHLVNYLNIHHNERMELSVFEDEECLKEYLERYQPDVLLLENGVSCLTGGSTIEAYLTEDSIGEGDRRCIFKYQKGDLIYKTILSLFAAGTDKELHGWRDKDRQEAKLHLFLPLNGGAGASTVSKAYALRLSVKKKTLYLNLEMFGNCEKVLKAEGDFSLDDVLYALKSRRGSLALKLECSLKNSREGIYYYAPSANPMNLLDLTGEEFNRLLSVLKTEGRFDEIVLDTDIFPSEWMLMALRESDDIWLVADGSEASNEKYDKFKDFIIALEKKYQLRIQPRMKIFYNKYNSKAGKPIEKCDLEIAGGCPRYQGAEESAIIKKMADSEVFRDGFL